MTDANGVTLTHTYDNLGRVVQKAYPDSGLEKFGYTANVNSLTSFTNQVGDVTRYLYDTAGRKTNEVSYTTGGTATHTNKYTYDSSGNLKTLTDPKNQVTTWNYDQYSRVTNKVDQASTVILRYSYDANSRLTNRWSAGKGDTKYTYNAVGDVTLVDYPVGTTDITLQYDALSRLTNMVDAAGTTKYTYHANGQLLTEDLPSLKLRQGRRPVGQ